ncbi:MAG TPA: hypothetical protein PKV27_08385 [Ilumatobacteraceae bacterium]|nr:hypothetical protein [Ilumatobacteraceae bacterium]
MRTIAAVEKFCLSLPEVTEGLKWGNRTWLVGRKGFCWPRPLSAKDIAQLGDERVPQGDIIGIHTDGMQDKAAILEANLPGVFTIHHFRSFPALLIELRQSKAAVVRELIVDSWLAVAPKKLAAQHADAVLARAK